MYYSKIQLSQVPAELVKSCIKQIKSQTSLCTDTVNSGQPLSTFRIKYTGTLFINSFSAKFQTKFVVCFSFFNKLSLGKRFIRKVERLNVKQHRSRQDGSYEPSCLDLYCLQKPIIIACGIERVKAMFQI